MRLGGGRIARATVLVVIALALGALPALAARKPAARPAAPARPTHDSLAVFPDTSEAGSAKPDTARRVSPPEFKGFEQPKWVMLRSLALPGWGQLHNGSWKKAVVIGGVEGLMVGRLVNDRSDLNRLNHEVDVAIVLRDQARLSDAATQAVAQARYADALARFNARSDKFIGHQWWLGAVLAYSMADAYIDAHFRNFGADIEDDPALPPEQRHAAGLRLYWQEHF